MNCFQPGLEQVPEFFTSAWMSHIHEPTELKSHTPSLVHWHFRYNFNCKWLCGISTEKQKIHIKIEIHLHLSVILRNSLWNLLNWLHLQRFLLLLNAHSDQHPRSDKEIKNWLNPASSVSLARPVAQTSTLLGSAPLYIHGKKPDAISGTVLSDTQQRLSRLYCL